MGTPWRSVSPPLKSWAVYAIPDQLAKLVNLKGSGIGLEAPQKLRECEG